jgi:hypothetical protein
MSQDNDFCYKQYKDLLAAGRQIGKSSFKFASKPPPGNIFYRVVYHYKFYAFINDMKIEHKSISAWLSTSSVSI